MSTWIDDACRLASGLSEAELKALLPAQIVMENGFVCPADGKWTNDDLASYFTGLFGLMGLYLSAAPSNQQFFDCLWESFLCDKLNDRTYQNTVSGTGTLTHTSPTGGNWCVTLIYNGAADYVVLNESAGIIPVIRNFNPDDDVNYHGHVTLPSEAGGSSYSVGQPGDGWASYTIIAQRKDCP